MYVLHGPPLCQTRQLAVEDQHASALADTHCGPASEADSGLQVTYVLLAVKKEVEAV